MLQAQAAPNTNKPQPGIDPTANVDPAAVIHETAHIGPNAVIDNGAMVGPHCVVGPHTRIRARAIIDSYTTLGAHNDVHPFCVLGGDPQDKAYDPATPNALHIGDANEFREYVTVSRGTGEGRPTVIGCECMLMAHAHVGHNCQLGDNVIMVNHASMAGHVTLGDRVVMSGFSTIHQFVRVGDGVMFSAYTGAGKHVPPFVTVTGHNVIGGLNRAGIKRFPGSTAQDRDDLREAYRLFFRADAGESMDARVAAVTDRTDWSPLAARFVSFITESLALTGAHDRGIIAGNPPDLKHGRIESLRSQDTEKPTG